MDEFFRRVVKDYERITVRRCGIIFGQLTLFSKYSEHAETELPSTPNIISKHVLTKNITAGLVEIPYTPYGSFKMHLPEDSLLTYKGRWEVESGDGTDRFSLGPVCNTEKEGSTVFYRIQKWVTT